MARADDIPPLDTVTGSFEDFFRKAPLPMKVLDGSNRVLHANAAIQQLVGFDESQLREMKQLELIHSADLYQFLAEFRAVCDGTSDQGEVEVRHYRADESLIPMLLTHIRLSTPQIEGPWILETGTDLSQQQRLKQQLVYLQSHQLLGQMARGVAHDFKNVLSVMSLALQLLSQKQGDDPEVIKLVDKLHQNVGRMTELSINLSELGKSQHVETSRLDVNESIEKVRGYIDYICPEQVDVAFQLGEDLPIIDASEAQLQQVLLNLVVNARDAIVEKGEGTITVQTRTEDVSADDERNVAEGRYAVMSVHDDGVGMDDESRAAVFEPFYSTKEEGTGVGLSTVYAIVQQGRGYIDIESEPGEGTKVCVYLPEAGF